MTPVEQKVWDLIAPGVAEAGLRLVRVKLAGSDRYVTLQVMIEPQSATRGVFTSVTLDECEKISRMASAILDVEDPIISAYTLEVSSPGVERPLVTKDDFVRYAPHLVRIDLTEPVDGRKRFDGLMEGLDGDDILLRDGKDESTVLRLPYGALRGARLVLTDKDWAMLMSKAPHTKE
jgi:ribosome maturation factor RimP